MSPTRPTLSTLESLLVWGLAALLATALVGLSACNGDHSRVEVREADCVLCHQVEYDLTEAPPHPGLFPITCADCHTETAWVPAVAIRHPWFTLRNRHAEAACGDCHTEGYRPGDTSSDCVDCHQQDYDMATAPPHTGYPTACQNCHTDAGWRPSIFDHPWPLDGAHVVTPCGDCHSGDPPVFAGTPTACVGCHREDYDRSAYPGHETFPLECANCHSTSAWRPALEGAHPDSLFPISWGPHSEVTCTECHDSSLGSSARGENTNCIGCHKHDPDEMLRKHAGEASDYPTVPPSPNFCLDCHPDGQEHD
jgi:hypothetical protein